MSFAMTILVLIAWILIGLTLLAGMMDPHAAHQSLPDWER